MKITVTEQAWETIRGETAKATDGLETGGILLGHDTDDHVRITVAGDPGPNAVREPKRFLRDLRHAQQLANTAWEIHSIQWVGEWHTHPGTEPVPSDVDINSYLRHLNDPDLGFTRFVSIIVGVVNKQTTVAAWVVTPDAASLTPFTIEGTT